MTHAATVNSPFAISNVISLAGLQFQSGVADDA
jgi:hypothetical protein